MADTAGVADLEARLGEVEALPDSPARELALEAITGVVDLYGAALARILELAPEVGPRLVADELLAHLLLLHDLHPVPTRDRVESALVSVRPYLASHAGDVELLSVEANVARVRLEGTCRGCPSSTATLKDAIERAIFDAAPEIVRVEAEGSTEPRPSIIPLESLVCPVPT